VIAVAPDGVSAYEVLDSEREGRVHLELAYIAEESCEGSSNPVIRRYRALSSLNHPSIPRELGVDVGGGICWLATSSSRGYLELPTWSEWSWPPSLFVAWLGWLLSVLDYVHGQGVSHGALSSRTVLVSEQQSYGEGRSFRLDGFHESLLDEGDTYGARWSSGVPGKHISCIQEDQRNDLLRVGALAHHVLSNGAVSSADLGQFGYELPAGCCLPEHTVSAIARMTDPDPSIRPSSAAEARSWLRDGEAVLVSARRIDQVGFVHRRRVARQLNVAMREHECVLALVGPEGSGKTFAGRIAETEARCAGWQFVKSDLDLRGKPTGSVVPREYQHGQLPDDLHAALATGRPSIVFFDGDDVVSMEGLRAAIEELRQCAGSQQRIVFVVATTSLPAAFAGHECGWVLPGESGFPRVIVHRLKGMLPEEVAKLAGDALCGTPSDELASFLHDRCEGHPAIAWEMLQQLSRRQCLKESPRGVEMALRPTDEDTLSSAWLLFDARLKRLSARQEVVAQSVSLGPGMTFDVVLQTTGLKAAELESVLCNLADADILARSAWGGAWGFASKTLRKRVYEGIPAQRRTELHDRVVSVLSDLSCGPCMRHSQSSALAWHLFHGTHPADAAESAIAAAAVLASDGEVDDAMEYVEMLGSLPSEAIGAVDGGVEALLQLARDCWRLGRASACARVCALGQSVADIHVGSDALAALGFKTLVAKAHVLNGDMDKAEAILRRVLADCDETGDPVAVVESYYALCMVHQMSGRFIEMEQLATECERVAERAGVEELARLASCAMGNAQTALCRWREAQESYLDQIEVLKRTGNERGLATAYGNLGRAHLQLGRWGAAESCFDRAASLARENGYIYALGLSLNNKATLQRRKGDFSLAASALAEARAHLEQSGDIWSRAALLSDLGDLHTARGALTSALEHFAESEDLMEQAGAIDDLPELHRRKAMCLLGLTRIEDAEVLASEAQHVAENMGNRLEAANGIRVMGEVASAKGEHDKAITLLEDAATRLRDLGAPYELNQTLQVLGRELLGSGSEEEGIAKLSEALEGFTRLGAKRDARKTQEELAAATGHLDPGPGPLPDEKERLAALYSSSHSLSSARSVHILIQDLADAAAAMVPADGVAVLVLPPGEEPAVCKSSLCDHPSTTAEAVSLVSPAMPDLEGCGTDVLFLTPETAGRNHAPLLTANGIERIALVPMRSKERLVGVLCLDHRSGKREFSEEDTRFLRALAVQAATLIENAQLRSKLCDEVESLRWVVDGRHKFSSIVGQSLSMQQLFSTLERVARTPVTVLIEGESGTGKELVARAVHLNGPRKGERFVAQNCAALPEQLLESELFGHMRGAFTGAHRDKQGLFEAADGGTFFLDEIADMPPSLQVKLLRVLQDGQIRRVGATDPIDVDVRIIAATNKCLRDEVQAGRFREDLFYRLNVVRVEMPPLRDRRDDIPLLAQHFLNRATEAAGEPERGFSDRAMELLVNYDWPGNVRELENEIERAVALSDAGATVTTECLSDRIRTVQVAIRPPRPGTRLSLKNMVEDVEKRVILQVLNENRWNKSRTAKALGLSRQGLLKKIARFGLKRDEE